MKDKKPESRTEATEPAATRHLDSKQKEALDLNAEVEHMDGQEREALTQKMTKLGGSEKKEGR